MIKEKVPFKVVGRWFDKYIYPDGREEFGEHGEFEWGYNQIQNTCAVLLASLLKGEAGYNYMNYFGVGSGDVSWDTTPPTKSYDQTTLENEYFRKSVLTTDIVYLDPLTDLVSGTPTSKIEVTVTLAAGEATGTLREFGLFGGTATATLDSGEMVNWISHARIDKDSALQIQRKVRIEFQTQ
jgi:hypothetical protein